MQFCSASDSLNDDWLSVPRARMPTSAKLITFIVSLNEYIRALVVEKLNSPAGPGQGQRRD